MKKILVLVVMIVIVIQQQVGRHRQNQKNRRLLKKLLKDRRFKKGGIPNSDRYSDNSNYLKYKIGSITYNYNMEYGFGDPNWGDSTDDQFPKRDSQHGGNRYCQIKGYDSSTYSEIKRPSQRSEESLDDMDDRQIKDKKDTLYSMTNGYWCQEPVEIKIQALFRSKECSGNQNVKSGNKWIFRNCWDENGVGYEWDDQMNAAIEGYYPSDQDSEYIYMKMRFMVRYDEHTDSCLLFSNKYGGVQLTETDKLILQFYYPPRYIGTTYTYTPYQQCVDTITNMFKKWNKSQSYVSIRQNGFKVTTYLPGAFIRLYFVPSARLYCSIDSNTKTRDTKKEIDDKKDINNKDKQYRDMIRIQKDQLSRDQSYGSNNLCFGRVLNYEFDDEKKEKLRKEEEEFQNEKREKQEKEAIERAKVTGSIGCHDIDNEKRFKKHKHIQKMRKMVNRLKKIKKHSQIKHKHSQIKHK